MFKDRLNQTRKNKGITAQQMADKLQVALRSYRMYESGDRSPSLDMLVQIADILNVSIDYLLCRDEFLHSSKINVGPGGIIMFAEKLRTARKSNGLTQRALAESLGITERAYQHYELGTREPNIEMLIRISLVLDISIDDLLCREKFRQSHEVSAGEC